MRSERSFGQVGRLRRLLLGLALMLAAVAVIVVGWQAVPRASAVTVPAKAAAPMRARGGGFAKAFRLRTIESKTFSLADARRKAVVVDFLAPGCSSCARDLAGLRAAAARFATRHLEVVVVDISGANDSKLLRDYYRGRYHVPATVVIGEDKGFQIARAYGVNELGMTFVIGRDGRIRWHGVWAGDTGKLFPAIEEASAR